METNTIQTIEKPVAAMVVGSGPWLALRLRSAIADKEWTIACANMETQRGGWTCDWHAGMASAQREIDAINAEVNGACKLRSALEEIEREAGGALNNAFPDEAPDVIANLKGIATRALLS